MIVMEEIINWNEITKADVFVEPINMIALKEIIQTMRAKKPL